jgi:hypothetical protein
MRPEPEEVEPQEQEELEPQFSPVEESSNSDSYESDSTASTGASSIHECDSGNDSYTSVDHFDSDEEEVNPNNDYRKICLLQQTIKLDGHDVNILYDDGVSMSTMSTKVAAPPLLKAVNSCKIVSVEGEGVDMETCPLVEVPLPLFNGGVGMAQVRVTNREFPLMTADPSMEYIADKLDFPVSSRDRIFSIQLWKSRLTGGCYTTEHLLEAGKVGVVCLQGAVVFWPK